MFIYLSIYVSLPVCCSFIGGILVWLCYVGVSVTIQVTISQVVSVFVNGLVGRISISGRVIPRLKTWYLIPPYFTSNIIRYVSTVKRSNPGKGVAPSSTPWCSSYWKEAFESPSTTVANLLRSIVTIILNGELYVLSNLKFVRVNVLIRSSTILNWKH